MSRSISCLLLALESTKLQNLLLKMMRFVVAVVLIQAAILVSGESYANTNRDGRILATYSKEIKEHTANALPELSNIDFSVKDVSSKLQNLATVSSQINSNLVSLVDDVITNLSKNSDLINIIDSIRVGLEKSVKNDVDTTSPLSTSYLFAKVNQVIEARLSKIEALLGYGRK